MNARIVLFALGIALVDGACEPSCSGHSAGDAIPDPLDCHNFYICLDTLLPTPAPFLCPDGQAFDALSLLCVDPQEPSYVCDKSCFVCEYECGSKSAVADPWDCSVYYECVEGVEGSARRCGEEQPFFDGASCGSDESKCCACQAYCSAADVGRSVPDPKSCDGYYQCLHHGPAQETHHKYCAEGHFDYLHQKCSVTFPCLDLCYESPTTGGCLETFVCEAEGLFPRCPDACDPYFYRCEVNDLGLEVDPQRCAGDMVFDPVSATCILEEDCALRA